MPLGIIECNRRRFTLLHSQEHLGASEPIWSISCKLKIILSIEIYRTVPKTMRHERISDHLEVGLTKCMQLGIITMLIHEVLKNLPHALEKLAMYPFGKVSCN